MATTEPGMRALLDELLPVLESIERTVVASNVKDPDRLPFDINEYRELVQESAATAAEMRQLMDSIAVIMAGDDELAPLLGDLVRIEMAVLNRSFYANNISNNDTFCRTNCLSANFCSFYFQVIFLEMHGVFDQNSPTHPAQAVHPQAHFT